MNFWAKIEWYLIQVLALLLFASGGGVSVADERAGEVVGSVDQSGSSDKAVVAELLGRLRLHSESVETLEVRWKQTVVYSPGTRDGKAMRQKDQHGRQFPGKEAELIHDCRVVLKGTKWRYETKGVMWKPDVEQFAVAEEVVANDDETVTSFQGVDASIDESHPQAYLYQTVSGSVRARAPQAVPAFYFGRPFQVPIGQLLQWEDMGWVPTVRESDDGGHFVELVYNASGQVVENPPTYRLFRDQPWLLKQMAYSGAVTVDVRYPEPTEEGAYPIGWRYAHTNKDGTPRTIYEAEVTSWQVNVPVDDAEFSVNLPPGTEVWDHRGRSPGGPASWIVRDDGSERPVTTNELQANVSYPDLLITEPDEAVRKPTADYSWFVKINAALILCALLSYGFTRWRRRQSD